MKTIIFSDFDGTITVQDSLDTVLDAFAKPSWRQEGAAIWEAGLGSRLAIEKELSLLEATREKIEALLEEKIELSPGFEEFLQLCRKQGWDFVILSEGFCLHIDKILGKYRLTDIPYYANELVFTEAGIETRNPHANPECRRCGNCKRAHMLKARQGHGRVIYIGDGRTDHCPAEVADQVFAKRHLEKYCQEEHIPYIPYRDFFDVLNYLRELN